MIVAISELAYSITVEIHFDATNFNPAFPDPIDNQYWPLLVGTSFAYKAETDDECEYNKLTVTGDSYYLSQVNVIARIVRDQEWITEVDEDGNCDTSTAVLVEDTQDYFAQDFVGNIWYFGENTWSWDDENEQCTADGAWEAGYPVADPFIAPAIPGIVMLANLSAGLRYQQEYLEDEAEDQAAVTRLNGTVSIDLGEYSNCAVIKEWTPLESGHVEHKHYCLTPAGSGLVFIEELKSKTTYVELIGSSLPAAFPGENSAEFPAIALGCGGP